MCVCVCVLSLATARLTAPLPSLLADLAYYLPNHPTNRGQQSRGVINFPHIVVAHFDKRVRLLLRLLKRPWKINWFWGRYEFQGASHADTHTHTTHTCKNYSSPPAHCLLYIHHASDRGSIHAHIILQLDDEPKPGMVQIGHALATTEAGLEFDYHSLHGRDGQPRRGPLLPHLRRVVAGFHDYLATAQNPNDPAPGLQQRVQLDAGPHPASKGTKETLKLLLDRTPDGKAKLRRFVGLCVNWMQRHTKCGPKCMRRGKCRTGVPHELRDTTKVMAVKVKHRDGSFHYETRILPRRNDAYTNTTSHPLLVAWAANCDLRVVVDRTRCLLYLCKYATKVHPNPAPRSL